jgi:hypothetical protein
VIDPLRPATPRDGAALHGRGAAYDGTHRFVPVLCSMNGHRVVEVPVSHRARRFGHPKFHQPSVR